MNERPGAGLETTPARSAYEIPLTTLAGEPLDPGLLRGRAALIVNVASRCGLTPQYEGLQHLYERYRDQGFVVLGTPCNQFAGQEPGSADEIAGFCSSEYAATFPLTEKLEVNGQSRHPLYALLTTLQDDSGTAGDVQWNFEKFLISPRGIPLARFRPTTSPDAEIVVKAIEAALPRRPSPHWSAQRALSVGAGDRVRLPTGTELTVSRVEHPFLGQEELVCLIEDTPTRWSAQPVAADSDVQVLETN